MASGRGVRLARQRDITPMAATLARAFAADPFFSYLAGDAPERNERMRAGWAGILRFSSAHLSHTYTTDDHAGVALWHPPGYTNPSVIDGFRLLPAVARLTGWRRLRVASEALAALEEHRKRHVAGRHFYLSALGVDPAQQGGGIGTALMEPVLELCDRDGTPAYLETATGRNVLLYERAGFDVVEELVLPTTDIHGWLMLRRPGPLPAEQRRMERDQSDRPLADGTGMDRPEELPAMESGDEESRTDEASGAEKTAVEGAAGIAATHRAFGGGAANAAGGIGTHVPVDEDEHMDRPQGEGTGESAEESTDPRGY